jgi:hypothetical protein
MNLPPDVVLRPDQVREAILWRAHLPAQPVPRADDGVLAPRFGTGTSRRIQTWGHDAQTVHWIGVRGGLPLHWDPGSTRYSYQWIVRNDGWRVHGLADDPTVPPMAAGTFYLLDSHSPHKVSRDPRLGGGAYYVALVYDVPAPLARPQAAWTIMQGRRFDPTVEQAVAGVA